MKGLVGSLLRVKVTQENFDVAQPMGTDMQLKNGLISAFAFFQSAVMVAAGESAPPAPVPAPAASGDSGSDAAVVLVVLLGVLLLAANGMKHGMAPVVACDDEDKNKSCDDNEVQN